MAPLCLAGLGWSTLWSLIPPQGAARGSQPSTDPAGEGVGCAGLSPLQLPGNARRAWEGAGSSSGLNPGGAWRAPRDPCGTHLIPALLSITPTPQHRSAEPERSGCVQPAGLSPWDHPSPLGHCSHSLRAAPDGTETPGELLPRSGKKSPALSLHVPHSVLSREGSVR